jgi:hypothetical protein
MRSDMTWGLTPGLVRTRHDPGPDPRVRPHETWPGV